MSEQLSVERIRELEQCFVGQGRLVGGRFERTGGERGDSAQKWMDWFSNYLAALERVHGLSDKDFRTPEQQKALWTIEGVASVGQGKNVKIDKVYADEQVVDVLASVRSMARDEEALAALDVEARAAKLQQAYDEILALMHPRLCKRRPKAKLYRALLVLVPRELHCALTWEAHVHVANLVLGRRDKSGPIATAVRVRDRFREALGQEQDLAEDVRRSMFCWWLHRNYQGIIDGDLSNPERAVKGAQASPATSDDEQSEPLLMRPYTAQRKGLPRIKGYVEAIRALLMSCQGGADRDELLAILRKHDVTRALSPARRRDLFNMAKWLDLIEPRDRLWFPSAMGDEVLETDPPDVLVKSMLEKVFGMAHLLRALGDAGPTGRKELIDTLTSRLAGSADPDRIITRNLAWMQALDLIEQVEGSGQDGQSALQVTEYGQGWLPRLPRTLPTPPDAPAIDDGEAPGEREAEIWTPPAFAALWDAFQRDDELSSFVFDERDVQLLHLAWHTSAQKRFAILAGLSGTGKTALLRHYARVYCQLVGLDWTEQCKVVAVSPDWRDPSGLLGYFNALSQVPSFQREPALNLVLAASQHPERPYFLILDEMNLAHVERYFAPFLSSMETGAPLSLHASDDDASDVPAEISWPSNLFIGGTVNMDETTHPFSDKVLDRAFTIEFWDVDLETFFARRREDDIAVIPHIEEVYAFLRSLNDELAAVRRHVGYRAVGEVLDMLCAAVESGMDAARDQDALWARADDVIHAKILPRLRGHDSEALRNALLIAETACQERKLARCQRKLQGMRQLLDEMGVTRFFS